VIQGAGCAFFEASALFASREELPVARRRSCKESLLLLEVPVMEDVSNDGHVGLKWRMEHVPVEELARPLRTLRSHGLVDSRRAGEMVMYSLTPAGRALLTPVVAEMRV
jgi:hypothetical protein